MVTGNMHFIMTNMHANRQKGNVKIKFYLSVMLLPNCIFSCRQGNFLTISSKQLENQLQFSYVCTFPVMRMRRRLKRRFQKFLHNCRRACQMIGLFKDRQQLIFQENRCSFLRRACLCKPVTSYCNQPVDRKALRLDEDTSSGCKVRIS